MLLVLGNGPSLAGVNFEHFSQFDAIGMSAAYRHWRRIGWRPRYYACLDTVVGVSHRAEIETMIRQADELGIDAFLLRDNLIQGCEPAVGRSGRVINFDELAALGGLLDVEPITTGSHAALFEALLGYRRMLLLGIDCDYVERLPEAVQLGETELQLLETPQRNPNYFFEGYQRAGDRYNIPNPVPDLHLECWRRAETRLAGRGIAVWNGSEQSRLDMFPRRSFERVRADLAQAEARAGGVA